MSKRQGKKKFMHSALELPQGTLDLLLLKLLALEPQHGWAMSQRLHQRTGGAVSVGHGSLYPALHRLERRGFLRASWQNTEHNRRAKLYELTAKGRRHLGRQAQNWRELSVAMSAILDVG